METSTGYGIGRLSRETTRERVDFPTTWREARELFEARSRGRGEVRLAHNTYLRPVFDPEGYGVFLHGTAVVAFLRSGWLRLESNGWQTPTTRDRMRCCGVRVSMAGGVAGVTLPDGREVAYRDGMRLLGSRTSPALPLAADCRRVRRRALARARRRGEVAWGWPTRSGGRAPSGNSPEGLLTPGAVRILLSGPRRGTRRSDEGVTP